MSKRIFIDGSINSELCIIATDGQEINYFDYSDELIASKKNNIYLGTVSRVEPSLQAAFIEFGSEKKAFLPFDEIHPSYFKIPHNEKIHLGNNRNDVSIDEEKESKKHFLSFYRKYKIQDVIKKDQVLLVQIVKEERGTKGAAITTFISLPGRYSVLLPNNSSSGGVSKKISNPLDRKRLKKLHDNFNLPDGMSLIIRTNAISAEDEDIIADFSYLRKLWTKIREDTLKSKAPILISELDTPIIKVARDFNQRSIEEIIFSDLKTMKLYKKLEKDFSVKSNKKITHYNDKLPLFESYGIKNPINSLTEENIYLKSGGYLVINPTEALVSIDINSGQSTKQMNIEKTAVSTNLEAAEEICRQIKLRDLSGLIVIDFIDMLNFYNKRTVEKKMRECVRRDRARIQIGRISNFGLLEMTRQRLREGSIKWETNLSLESFSQKIVKKIEMLAFNNKIKIIKAYLPEKVSVYINTYLSKEISYFQKKYSYKIEFIANPHLIIPEYKIELLNKSKKIINKIEKINQIIDSNFKKVVGKQKIDKVEKKNEKVTLKNFKGKNNNKKISKPRTLWTRRKKAS